jgi:ubiquinone/menaquinone biosynthesis C-methylase UbiE
LAIYSDHIFPRLLDMVGRHFDDDRREVLRHAQGRVLELGVGTGSSLGFYPAAVTDLVGIDPFQSMVARARASAERLADERGGLPYRLHLHRADARALPYADESFDVVVAFLTLCTVPRAERAAREMRRVLRPDGSLLVLEHVRARDGRPLARWQDRLDPLWTRVAGGCHLNRDTAGVLAEAGFDVAPLERYRDQRYFPPTAPRIRGVIGPV